MTNTTPTRRDPFTPEQRHLLGRLDKASHDQLRTALGGLLGSRDPGDVQQVADALDCATGSVDPPRTRADWCSCGRPARVVLDGGAEWGPTGYCGIAQPPLDPCGCGQGAERHDRSVCGVYGRGMAS